MNNKIKDTTEEVVLEKMLFELDNGVSIETLETTFKDYPEAIHLLKMFLGYTQQVKESVIPDTFQVSQALTSAYEKYSHQGRAHILLINRYDTILSIMKNVLKIGLPVLAVLLIIVGVNMNKKEMPSAQSPLDRQIMAQEATEVTPAPATGNIDDILVSFTSELNEETALMQSTDSNGTIATADAQIITNYKNAYDETQF